MLLDANGQVNVYFLVLAISTVESHWVHKPHAHQWMANTKQTQWQLLRFIVSYGFVWAFFNLTGNLLVYYGFSFVFLWLCVCE